MREGFEPTIEEMEIEKEKNKKIEIIEIIEKSSLDYQDKIDIVLLLLDRKKLLY